MGFIAICLLASPIAFGQSLRVNFGVSPDGPPEPSYQPYLALDRSNGSEDPVNGADRTEAFAAFGGTVHLTVSYPDLQPDAPVEQARVKRVINRSDEHTARYLGTKNNLMRGWIGLDVRHSPANSTPTPTTFRLELADVPAGTYLLRTYHHDVRNQHGRFTILTSDAKNSNALLGDGFRITTSDSNVVNDGKADPGEGNGPELLRSTIEQVVVSDGINPIRIDFQMVREHVWNQDFIFVLNGLELVATSDTDGDRIQDSDDPNPGEDDRALDDDGDGLSNFEELLRNLDPINEDTDGDGRTDNLELDHGRVAVREIDSISISIDPESEDVTLTWDPASASRTTIQSSTDLKHWMETIAGVTSGTPFALPGTLASEPKVFFRVLPPIDFGTSPWIGDTDGDGISDGDEINIHGSSPFVPSDRDGDGYDDHYEIIAGSDPDDINNYPAPDPEQALFVDFNSSGDSSTDPDPSRSAASENQRGYQSYHANHEVAAEFTMATYGAFGTSVTLLPTWPQTTDNRVQQSIDRSSRDDIQWVGDQIDLLTDWIGVDARIVNGGNGGYDGITGSPTSIDLTIAGLPAGTYDWISFHHDTEYVWADFVVEIDTGTGFGPVLGPFNMTNSSLGNGGIPGNRHRGWPTDGTIDPVDLPSTFKTTFTANGSDVTFRFTPLSEDTNIYRQLFAVNGFQLTKSSP